jgi:hypothetical protein
VVGLAASILEAAHTVGVCPPISLPDFYVGKRRRLQRKWIYSVLLVDPRARLLDDELPGLVDLEFDLHAEVVVFVVESFEMSLD